MEEQKHREAFKTFYEMGTGRTLRAMARMTGIHVTTLSLWSREFHWKKRIAELNKGNPDGVGALRTSVLTPIQSPGGKFILNLMKQCEAILESSFEIDSETGKLTPKFSIKNATDYSRVLKELRELTHLLYEVNQPKDPKKQPSDIVDKLKKVMDGFTDEQKLEFLKGGNGESEGDIQDADYTEIPSNSNEDSDGCDALPDSDEPAQSGDESPVRES